MLGHDSRRALYSGWLLSNVTFVDSCFAYRLKRIDETDDLYTQQLASKLEKGDIAPPASKGLHVYSRTVSGTTLGALPAVLGYFKAIRALCDKYDVLLLLNEVGF